MAAIRVKIELADDLLAHDTAIRRFWWAQQQCEVSAGLIAELLTGVCQLRCPRYLLPEDCTTIGSLACKVCLNLY